MILVDVQYDAYHRMEMKEAVRVFTGFRHEQSRCSDFYITADGFQYAADRYGRIQFSCEKYMGKHGSRGRLAVGTGDGNRDVIIGHELSEQFGPAEHGKPFLHGSLIFFVVFMYGRRIYRHIYSVYYIRSFLSIEYSSAQAFEVACQCRLFIVRA